MVEYTASQPFVCEPIPAPLTKYVQSGDVSWHGLFQKRYDAEYLKRKTALFATKAATGKPPKLTASETRDLIVECGSHVWYEQITDEERRQGFLRSGLGVKTDGSENHLVDVCLPGSGKRLFPDYGNNPHPLSLPTQAGFGVQICGRGAEVSKTEAPAEARLNSKDFERLTARRHRFKLSHK